MKGLVASYQHRTGEHCASTALRNILHFHGVELSEAMIVGLSSGLGFYYVRKPEWSPTRMMHGRTATLETDFCRNTGIAFEDRAEPDDERAWIAVRERIDSGRPVMISTDTYYLGYHRTTSHFPGHRAVVVGYDTDAGRVLLADRKFERYQICSFDELRRSRNADDHPQSCENRYGDFQDEVKLGLPLVEAIRAAMRRSCRSFLTPPSETVVGTGGMRALAADFASWQQLDDWSWAARFGYQVVVKRGAGGSFFRSLYADFLEEAARLVPAIGSARLPQRMAAIAARWRDLAAILSQQSERERCDPELFVRAGSVMGELAEEEEAFFRQLQQLVEAEDSWDTAPRGSPTPPSRGPSQTRERCRAIAHPLRWIRRRMGRNASAEASLCHTSDSRGLRAITQLQAPRCVSARSRSLRRRGLPPPERPAAVPSDIENRLFFSGLCTDHPSHSRVIQPDATPWCGVLARIVKEEAPKGAIAAGPRCHDRLGRASAALPNRGKEGVMSMANLLRGGVLLAMVVGLLALPGSAFAAGGITGSVHDLNVYSTDGSVDMPDDRICVACHTPHNANTASESAEFGAAPLWNHEASTGSHTAYTSGTINATDLAAPAGISLLCLSCHDGSITLDAFGVGTRSPGSAVATLSGSALFGEDLSNDHPISFTYDATLATADGELHEPSTKASGVGSGNIDDDMLFGASLNQLECASCHDVHNGPGSIQAALLVKSNASSALCLTCHVK
jgi:predicted CXXCH cytochrome family protein